MRRGWEDLVARTRGLTTELLGRARLIQLAQARDLVHLASALEELRRPPGDGDAALTPEALELGSRRMAARFVRVLTRWGGDRAPVLEALLLDEDRRSVRALLRGAAAAAPERERLAGLVPTPLLPERALEEVSRQPSVSAVAALLSVWGHPFGRALLPDARARTPDLFRLELLINREFVARALLAARRASRGDAARRDLLAFVRRVADLENAWSALQVAGAPSSVKPEELFLPGGRSLSRATFLAAAAAPNEMAADAHLGRALRGTPLDGIFARSHRSGWEDEALAAELRLAVADARRSPLGVAPLIAFLVRVRAELRDLRFIIWRLAFGAPPATAADLVTAA